MPLNVAVFSTKRYDREFLINANAEAGHAITFFEPRLCEETLFEERDVLTPHCPLTPQTHHMVDDPAIEKMRDGVMIINTSGGGLPDTQAVIRGLKTRKTSYL